MNFKIVYDQPHRIRFRCGGFAFDKELEYSIYKRITSEAYVTDAEIHCENGGILICYKDGSRSDVIKLVSSLDPRKMEIVPVSSDYSIAEIDRRFKDSIFDFTLKKLASKLFLPMCIRKYIIIYNGLKYVLKGIKTLFDGKLTVDVLDGASIGACLIQKNYKTDRKSVV